ncbi:esterase B1-like isoform X1 [Anastrepha ludens]|uniref:esterase B1-like isoform X1 n=1 Tax=Anastrepha ludens TaxID=28586 RepID=UPI0023B05FF7|nr:esterase B1-like isoform X1 [Anastrepha ludens]
MIPLVGFVDKLRWRLNLLQNKYTQYRLSTNEMAVADTEYGQVKGLKRRTHTDASYYSFEGIPYAKPPVGELRFRAPQRPEPWTGVLNCLGPRDKSIQVHLITKNIEGSEDCLYLNVYTKDLKRTKPRPVMVWIHGGGFISGEASRDWFGPDYLMEKDVILVTVQYRLGVFGFLFMDSPELNVPGNAALKDQILALRWVKSNIANFGGDPNCITLFGQSAGSAAAHYLCITEQTRGLFHRAILMSGVALWPWAVQGPRKIGYPLALLAGYKGEDDEQQVLEYLMKCKAIELTNKESMLWTVEELKDNIRFPFVPCIEPYETAESVILKSPRELMKTAWTNTIPLMVGGVSEEGVVMLPFVKQMPTLILKLETCRNFVPAAVVDDEEIMKHGQKLKSIHVDGDAITSEHYIDLKSYWLFYFPIHRTLLSRLNYAPKAPTYLYRFACYSEVMPYPYRSWCLGGRAFKGVCHGDELPYLFWNAMSHRLPEGSPEHRTMQRMIGMWTHFAATGNPNNKELPEMESINWEAIKEPVPAYKCMNIGEELEIIDWPEMRKIKVWESTYDGNKELLY